MNFKTAQAVKVGDAVMHWGKLRYVLGIERHHGLASPMFRLGDSPNANNYGTYSYRTCTLPPTAKCQCCHTMFHPMAPTEIMCAGCLMARAERRRLGLADPLPRTR